MIVIDLPEPPRIAVNLQSDVPLTKGTSPVKDLVQGALELGVPKAIPLTADLVKDDPVIAKFIAETGADFKFYLLQLTCTFIPPRGEPFREAWLTVSLVREDGPEPRPTVWSMRPERQTKPVELTRTVKLGGSLKFMDLGGDASGQTQSKITLDQVFLMGYAVDSEPFWEFRCNEQAEIDGSYHLELVVRAPKNITGRADVSLRATLERKKLGVIPYTAEFPGAGQNRVVLP